MPERPALCLEGLELKGGWKVLKRLDQARTDTGGGFSVQYKVVGKDGKEAFLKALDFSKAFQTADPSRALQAMTEAYNFERDLLNKCKERKLSKIIIPLDDGKVDVPGEVTALRTVMYLIFELADGNIRQLYNLSKNIDLAWCLRSLHNTAVALNQLHSHRIAHQDLKPSNVLVFQKQAEFKITDLGRASLEGTPCENDEYRVPGDMGYAPFELLYGHTVTNKFDRRYGIDLYHLGSLIFFYFADISATQAIKVKLAGYSGPTLDNHNFVNDLPYIRKAFFEAIKDLEKNIRTKAGDLTDEIIVMVKELCEPDPGKRGNPLDRNINQHNLERYISKLDLLTKKAEYMVKK
ncbi:MAG: protein kinase [Candidatus Omnitrophica bacterium]|nr:protein kinase [Candidatus Omnitrophota bacterium]